jgi:hypothetical protein
MDEKLKSYEKMQGRDKSPHSNKQAPDKTPNQSQLFNEEMDIFEKINQIKKQILPSNGFKQN